MDDPHVHTDASPIKRAIPWWFDAFSFGFEVLCILLLPVGRFLLMVWFRWGPYRHDKPPASNETKRDAGECVIKSEKPGNA